MKEEYEDRGELLSDCCTSSPASEPIGDNGNKGDDIIALCSKCKDWTSFIYDKDLEEENEQIRRSVRNT